MTYTPPLPTNSDDVIDSRDVIHWIEQIESIPVIERGLEDLETLDALYALQREAEDYAADWAYGETLIRDDYFEEYAEQLADDIGAIDRNAGWPLTCIDWKAAADDLKMDYTAVDFDGVTYWIRREDQSWPAHTPSPANPPTGPLKPSAGISPPGNGTAQGRRWKPSPGSPADPRHSPCPSL